MGMYLADVPGVGGSVMVVVVEDEPDILLMIRDALSLAGHECLGFHRPFDPDALPEEPALFVFDMMLPERSGIELARDVREHGFAETPMVAMSASPAMINAAAATSLFQDYLPKPFDIGQLLDMVDRLVA